MLMPPRTIAVAINLMNCIGESIFMWALIRAVRRERTITCMVVIEVVYMIKILRPLS